jgi:hypothetical protein
MDVVFVCHGVQLYMPDEDGRKVLAPLVDRGSLMRTWASLLPTGFQVPLARVPPGDRIPPNAGQTWRD